MPEKIAEVPGITKKKTGLIRKKNRLAGCGKIMKLDTAFAPCG
jgi:hypothetical protein